MNQITVTELATYDAPDVIDVRETHEYDEGHVPSAVNIPLSELTTRGMRLPTDSVLYVVCQSGGRSARAAEALNAAGIRAVNVIGGTTAWIQADLALETR